MRQFNVIVNGESYQVEIEELGVGAQAATPTAAPAPKAAAAPAAVPEPKAAPAPTAAPKAAAGAGDVTSPLPGTILRINAQAGKSVKAGEVILILEAMKMENEIVAPEDGVVKVIYVQTGATVQSGDPLFKM